MKKDELRVPDFLAHILPAYELDDGALTESEIKKIRKLSAIDQDMAMTCALFA